MILKLYSLQALVTSLLSFAVGLFIFSKNRKSLINKTFALWTLSVTVWAFGISIHTVTNDALSGLIWSRILHAAAIFIPTFFLHFTFAILDIRDKKWILWVSYLGSIILFAFNFTDLFMSGVRQVLNFKYFPIAGPAYPLFVLMFAACVIYSLYNMFKAIKVSSGVKRNQIKYLFLGAVIGFSGGSTTFFPVFNIKVFPIGNFFIFLYIVLIAYAILKYRLMDINVIITKGMTYAGLAVLIGSCTWGLMLVSDKAFSRYTTYNPFLSHFLIFLLIILSLIYFIPYIKVGTEKKIEQVLFRNKYQYRDRLRRFNSEISFSHSQKELLNKTVNFISEVISAPQVCIVLKDETYNKYTLRAAVGFTQDKINKLQFSGDSALIKRLFKNKEVLIREEIDEIITSVEERRALNKDLKRIDAYLCIPLRISANFIGILSLAERRSNEMYSNIDIDLLQNIANELSLFISYKQLEQHMLQSQKLTSLGTLASGIAHEIKNPLTSIKTFTQLLPQKYDDKEFRDAFSKNVVRDADRISELIDNILSLAKSKPPQAFPCNINQIIDETLSLLNTEIIKSKIQLSKNFGRLPSINVNKEELKQVFLNIILNAIQAMSKGGILKITSNVVSVSTVEESEQRHNYVRVEIQDTGCGIEEKLLNRLFDPFFTTKSQGTGLGLALAHRIVKQHQGFIGVDSKFGAGATFWINLPI